MPITKEIPVPIVEVGMFLGQDDVLLSQEHGPHTDLVQKEAAGEDAKMSLILAHAED